MESRGSRLPNQDDAILASGTETLDRQMEAEDDSTLYTCMYSDAIYLNPMHVVLDETTSKQCSLGCTSQLFTGDKPSSSLSIS